MNTYLNLPTLYYIFPAWQCPPPPRRLWAQVSHERRGFYLLSPAEKGGKERTRQARGKKSVMEVVGFNFQQKQVSKHLESFAPICVT